MSFVFLFREDDPAGFPPVRPRRKSQPDKVFVSLSSGDFEIKTGREHSQPPLEQACESSIIRILFGILVSAWLLVGSEDLGSERPVGLDNLSDLTLPAQGCAASRRLTGYSVPLTVNRSSIVLEMR